MRALVSKHFTSMVIIVSIALGFLLPEIGELWRPYLSVLLMILMFFVSLDTEPKMIKESLKDYRVVLFALFMVFVFTPCLAFLSRPFFSSDTFVGTVLAFSSPSAIATPFWTSIFNGDVATAIVVSTSANLLAVISMPLTMFLTVGSMVSVDVTWMMLNLTEVILIPVAAAFLFKKAFHISVVQTKELSSKIELAILVLLVWGSIAHGAASARGNVAEFLVLSIFMLVTLGLAFAVSYLVGKRFGRKQAITFGIAACVKNAALALVVGLDMFGPAVLPPLIANLIAQNLLLIPLKALLRED
jgi:predicted Na+-dependent transporter